MKSLNKVTLIGNLGRDPEIRYTASGEPIANVALATNMAWRDKDGRQKEQTEWHRLIFFGKLAEIVQRFLKKGQPIYVEGRLQTRKWQDNDGKDKFTTEIVVNEMIMLNGERTSNGNKPSDALLPTETTTSSTTNTSTTIQNPSELNSPEYIKETWEDDIPF